jgi:uncharacterized protein (DUF488 family)
MENESFEILTIGHSTRSLSEFIGLLQENEVECVVDIRTIPRSRFNPQFNKDTLPAELAKVKIDYIHLEGLGGLRHTTADSPNTGWRNASFRGFADYMQSDDFEKSLDDLITIASKKRSVIMCAEAVPWRCHRSLVSDALLARNINVEHIMGPGKKQPHKMTPFAVIENGKITYPSYL